MILKRKSEQIQSKSKIKEKQSKLCQKKVKKQSKLHGSASTRSFKMHKNLSSKPTIQIQDRENENNFNYLNTVIHLNQKHQTNTHKQHAKNTGSSNNAKLRKSSSAGVLKNYRVPRRSLSPFYQKQTRQMHDVKEVKQKNVQLKNKYSSKHTSRSQKEFTKDSSAKLKNLIKKHQEKKVGNKTMKNISSKGQKTNRNQSQHLKTDISSRMPSISRQLEKKVKKGTKPIKMKDLVKVGKKSAVKEIKANKHKAKNSIVFSDVSFNDMSIKNSKKKVYQHLYDNIQEHSNSYSHIEELTIKIKAAITIQRHYRGYYTRKCIEQLKQMTYCAIKIQKVWRGYQCRSHLNKQGHKKSYRGFVKKNLSIQNSLVTIKDFSEEPKQHKNFKFFNFDNESSHKKSQIMSQDRLDSGRRNPTENKKYLQILESLLNQEQLQEKYKERIRSTLKLDVMNSNSHCSSNQKQFKKQVYVKNKINSQIISQKSFNSPRSMCSPGIAFPSPKSSSKNKSNFNGNPQKYNSPNLNIFKEKDKYDSEKIEQRIVVGSPCKQSAIKSLGQKNDENILIQKKEIRPFDTTFDFIEEFQLIIVDFLRDNDRMKDLFIARVKQCQHHRTMLVLKEWDKFCEQSSFQNSLTPQFAYTQEYHQPTIFDQGLQSLILEEPAMKIYLEAKNYCEQSWKSSSQQKQAYESYIKLIFNVFTQAIYKNYNAQIITKNTKFYGVNYDGHELFKWILMNSLTSVSAWCECQCGIQIPLDQMDPNYVTYCQINQEKMQVLVNNDLKPILKTEFDSWILWIVIMVGEIIFQSIIQEFQTLIPPRKTD